MDPHRLPGLVDAALAALATERAVVKLSLSSDERSLTLVMPRFTGRFGAGTIADTLEWERFVDTLPKAVERARLAAMYAASGVDPPAPWSVYTSATALAWLNMAWRSTDGHAWMDNVAEILLAAEDDGEVRLGAPDGSTMHGVLRSRRLRAEIRLGPRVVYKASERRLIAQDAIPETIADASTGRHVGELVDVPWLLDANVRIASATTATEGTVFTLEEGLVPLEPIPVSAMSAAPPSGPSYAPWIATRAERAALDEVDAAAHRFD